MKHYLKISVWLLITATLMILWTQNLTAQPNENVQFSATEKWATEAIFDVPESVCFNPGENVLYVANISGKPTEKNGQGFISKLNMSGEIIELKWFTGLDAPKGMGIYDNKLFVTNIDEVVAIDLKNAKEVDRWNCEGAKFANDIAITENGHVFVSGMQNGAIYRLANGKMTKWKAEKTFTKPNGLWTGEKYLFVGAENSVYQLDYNTAIVEKYIDETLGVDGLEKIDDDFFLKSDWSGHVHVVSPIQGRQLILNTTDENVNAADIEFIPSENLMLVPTFFDNRVVAYEIIRE